MSTIAQGPLVRIAYITEATPGTTPTNGAFTELRTTSRKIDLKKNIIKSNEIHSDRNLHDFRHGFHRVEGNLGFELGIGVLDDMLESLTGGTWGGAGTNVLNVGTTLKTFTFERQFLDVGKYQVFKGVAINNMSLNLTPEQMVGGGLDILGMKDGGAMGTNSLGGTNTIIAAPTNQPFTTFEGAITRGGTAMAVVTGIQMNITNSRQLTPVVGSKYSPAVFEGHLEVAGTISAFFEDNLLYEDFRNETADSLQIVLTDLGGAMSLTIDLPAIKFNGDDMDPQQEGGVVQSIPFMGKYGGTNLSTVTFTRDNAP